MPKSVLRCWCILSRRYYRYECMILCYNDRTFFMSSIILYNNLVSCRLHANSVYEYVNSLSRLSRWFAVFGFFVRWIKVRLKWNRYIILCHMYNIIQCIIQNSILRILVPCFCFTAVAASLLNIQFIDLLLISHFFFFFLINLFDSIWNDSHHE